MWKINAGRASACQTSRFQPFSGLRVPIHARDCEHVLCDRQARRILHGSEAHEGTDGRETQRGSCCPRTSLQGAIV
jgi:hypothetical protein